MELLIYILVFTFLGSIASLIGGIFLLSKKELVGKISHYLFSFAAGVLLGTAFFDLLPEAFEEIEHLAEEGIIVETNIFLWTFLGIIGFFFLVRFLHWFHHHDDHFKDEPKQTVPLIVVGDTVHNFIDGMIIAASFFVSIPLGILTAIAVAIHEIPQEIGDFAILIKKGLPKKKIIQINLISAAAAMVGAMLVFVLGESVKAMLPMFLALTAGFFIYIATADLIPEIHKEDNQKVAFMEALLLVIGALTVYGLAIILESANLHG
jgi:zinc and cadmium transporter